jgi:UDP-N-acetylglucosamine--N-acetylmuramyl-(pentapeptide) pyrophosphoryl-undecaprenol N-acetylglucosamine transferase
VKAIIAGGGTAGHINPGLAIGKYLRDKKGAEILFIGTKKGFETKLVPLEGFTLKTINVRGFRRSLSFDTFVAIKELFQGLFQARKILKEYKPDIVIGTGGYVCGPVLFAASRLKIPTLIHEQNAYPGLTNRILSRFVKKVAISFSESEKYFKTRNLIMTGNPIRNDILEADRQKARIEIGLDADRKLVVIFGGSRGAEKINETVSEMLVKYYSEKDFDIIYATGESQFRKISERLWHRIPDTVKIVPYIYDMAQVMSSADLVVSRAGAITISELTALGIPAILIPSPHVTANHQEHNARALEKAGAAVVMTENELKSELLYDYIKKIITDDEIAKTMSRNSKNIAKLDATEKIYSIIQQLTNTTE